MLTHSRFVRAQVGLFCATNAASKVKKASIFFVLIPPQSRLSEKNIPPPGIVRGTSLYAAWQFGCLLVAGCGLLICPARLLAYLPARRLPAAVSWLKYLLCCMAIWLLAGRQLRAPGLPARLLAYLPACWPPAAGSWLVCLATWRLAGRQLRALGLAAWLLAGRQLRDPFLCCLAIWLLAGRHLRAFGLAA